MQSIRFGFGSHVQQIFSTKRNASNTFGLNVAKHTFAFPTAPKQSFSNSFKTNTQRSFATTRGDNAKVKGVPLAFFSDYTDGKVFTVNPPKKEDKTAIVGFLKGPKGYEASPEQALASGFQGLWIKRNEYSDAASIYTLAFDDTFGGSIDQYMQEKVQTFIDRYQASEGKHYKVDLDRVVTDHLTKKNNVECKAALFSTGQTSLYEPPLFGKLIMLLKTPGGFWELSLHANVKHLLNPSTQTAFTKTVRDLKIFWKDEVEPESMDKTTKVTNKQSLLD
jgi:hypothetical protein